MRVLLMSGEKFPPYYAFLETVYARLLVARGHEVVWVMPARGQAAGVTETTWNGNRVLLIPALTRGGLAGLVRHYARQVSLLAALTRRLAAEHFDAVLVRDDALMALAGRRLASRLGAPLLFQVSHLKEEQMLVHAWRGDQRGRLANLAKGLVGLALRQLALAAADLVLPMSDEMGRYLGRLGVAERRRTVLREGADTRLDPAGIQPVPLPAPPGPGPHPVLVYAGTMSRFRELDFLFGVLARVHARYPTARLLMVGDGPDADDVAFLERAAAERGLTAAVTFAGRVPRDEVPRWLRAAQVGLCPFPSNFVLRKNCPIKPMEYLACALAVVASDTPELRLLIESSGGGFCVPHATEPFADAVLALLDDPARAARMAADGRRFVVADRSLERCAERVEACLVDARARAGQASSRTR